MNQIIIKFSDENIIEFKNIYLEKSRLKISYFLTPEFLQIISK